MRIITNSEGASNVKDALREAIKNLNERLADTPGRISKMEANVDVGMSGASVRIVVAVDESEMVRKRLIWTNEAGGSEASALEKAEKKINDRIGELEGEVAGFYQEFISPPIPKRTYATLIAAINEQVEEKVSDLTFAERRERLASVIRLLGNDPRAVNISYLADLFDVSRDTIYRDLREIGVKR